MARTIRRIALIASAAASTIWVLAGAAEAAVTKNHNETFGRAA